MKSITAAKWNALVDRLRREQVLGSTLLERGGWRHPWQVSASWDDGRGSWTAEIHPGFVNGLDAEIRLPAAEAPEATLERLGLDRSGGTGARVDAWLTERPRMTLSQWRALGADASPESVSAADFETLVESFEPVPEFFRELAAGGEASRPRLLRATEIVLRQDRIATATDWTRGSGADGTFVQFAVVYRTLSGARERAYLRSTLRHVPPAVPGALARLRGDWTDEGHNDLHLATVYLLSPEGEPPGSDPGPDWTPYARHRVFWNLVHAVNFEPPAPRSENLTLFTGLAGGVADSLINQTLATVNDTSAMLSEFLGNRTLEGRFWSV